MAGFWDNTVWEEAEKEQGGFEALPEGDYTAVIIETTNKETTKGGNMLKVKLEIVGPTHKGRVVFDNINWDNANIKAVEIGLGTLKQITAATGTEAWYEKLKTVPDKGAAQAHLETLHNVCAGKPIKVRLQIEQREGYDPQNKVKTYKKSDGAATVTTGVVKRKPF